jgi:hypothetical protein
VETILAMIFSYLVFITRTWTITRVTVLAVFGLSVVYDFTPLRRQLGYVETAALSLTLAIWLANVVFDSVVRRSRSA